MIDGYINDVPKCDPDEVTDWYPLNIAPVRTGDYHFRLVNFPPVGNEGYRTIHFDGQQWTSAKGLKVTPWEIGMLKYGGSYTVEWRGLAHSPMQRLKARIVNWIWSK